MEYLEMMSPGLLGNVSLFIVKAHVLLNKDDGDTVGTFLYNEF